MLIWYVRYADITSVVDTGHVGDINVILNDNNFFVVGQPLLDFILPSGHSLGQSPLHPVAHIVLHQGSFTQCFSSSLQQSAHCGIQGCQCLIIWVS